MTRLLWPAMLLVALPVSAAAQTPSPPRDDLSAHWLSVGANFTALTNPEVNEFLPGLHMRVNLAKRVAAEIDASRDLHVSGLRGPYQLLVHFSPDPTGRRVVPFFTAGGAGFFERFSVPESMSTLLSGDIVTRPAHRRGRLSAPLIGIVGGGARFRGPGSTWVHLAGHFWMGDGGGLIGFRCALDVPVGPRRGIQ